MPATNPNGYGTSGWASPYAPPPPRDHAGAQGGISDQTSGDSRNGVGLPHFVEDRERLGGLLAGQSPFASTDWGALVSHLQGIASGKVQGVAGQQYQQAMGNASNGLSSMAHGLVRAGMGRAVQDQQGQMGQGMVSGTNLAQLQERQAAQQSLQGALGTRDSVNSSAYQNILGQQLGLSSQQVAANLGITNSNNQALAAQYQALGTGLAIASRSYGK